MERDFFNSIHDNESHCPGLKNCLSFHVSHKNYLMSCLIKPKETAQALCPTFISLKPFWDVCVNWAAWRLLISGNNILFLLVFWKLYFIQFCFWAAILDLLWQGKGVLQPSVCCMSMTARGLKSGRVIPWTAANRRLPCGLPVGGTAHSSQRPGDSCWLRFHQHSLYVQEEVKRKMFHTVENNYIFHECKYK